LKITELIRDPNEIEKLYANTSLCPGDEVKALNGQAVQTPFEYAELESQAFQKEVTLRVLRHWPPDSEQETMVDVIFPTFVGPTVENFRNEYDLAHFCSLVPRLKVAAVSQPGRLQHFSKWVQTTLLRRTTRPFISELLQVGDVIVKVGQTNFPSYKQLRELTTEYKEKDLPITILRKNDSGVEQRLELTVHPKTGAGSDRVVVGFSPELDMDSAVVAQVIPVSGMTPLPSIPTGAVITSVDGHPVSNFYEIAQQMQKNIGQKISLDYIDNGQAGGTAVVVPEYEPVHAEAAIAVGIPFEELTREFKASTPLKATQMGLKKTWQFILRSYVTLIRLLQGSLPTKALSGPVGIISMTYQVAGTTAAHYFYFLGLISSCLAVMNLLPLPVLDGGHIVILLIEKFSGKPINERVLAAVMYAGMAFLLGLILLITYFDLTRMLGS
jgi:RIP metalloprotease RseP